MWMEIGSKRLADYLKNAISDFQQDNDTTRFVRRMHIKRVHLKRRNDKEGAAFLKRMRRFMEV